MTTKTELTVSAVEFASFLRLEYDMVFFRGGVTSISFSVAPASVIPRAMDFLDYMEHSEPDFPELVQMEKMQSPFSKTHVSVYYNRLWEYMRPDFANKVVRLNLGNVVVTINFPPTSSAKAIENFLDIFRE